MSGWQDDFILDEVRETKGIAIGVSRGLRDVQQSLKANGLRSPGKATKPSRRPGDLLLKAAISELLRPMTTGHGGGVIFEKDAIEVARSLYGGDHDLHDWIRRAATNPVTTTMAQPGSWKAVTNPATTTTTGYASELLSTATIDFLISGAAPSGFAQLAAQTLSVSVQESVKIPSRVYPLALAGSWVAEGSPKPVFTVPLTSITMSPNKLVAITAWSEELSTWSVPSVENVVRDALVHDLNALLDASAFDSNAAVAARPAGLFNGVTPSTGTAGGGQAAVTADIGTLLGAIAPALRPVLVANASTAARLSVWAPALSVPVIVSEAVADDTLAAIDAAAIVTMVGDLRFSASSDATLHMSDVPLPLGSGTQGSGVLAVPAMSAFQMDLIALKSTLYCTWKKRRSNAVAIAGSVSW